jgi:zinc transport system substrate-binding protein
MKMVFMHKLARASAALFCASVVAVAAACGSVTGSPSATRQGGRLVVVAAFYPFQFIAERVAGAHATVESLTKPGAEPHDLELTPKQVAQVGSADLVIYERSFQAAVDEAVDQSGNASVLDTATVARLQDLRTQNGAEPATTGSSRFLDPHVWLDPNNVSTIAGAVEHALSKKDPAHAADYARNAHRLTVDLTALDRDYRSGLASCQRQQFITQHAAFGYLANRYGLTQVGISGLSPDTEPSPARIAKVQKEARTYGVTTIFYETLASPAVAKAIANDLGLKTDVLDPIEGITPASRGQDYLAVMKSNLASLRVANGCRR